MSNVSLMVLQKLLVAFEVVFVCVPTWGLVVFQNSCGERSFLEFLLL